MPCNMLEKKSASKIDSGILLFARRYKPDIKVLLYSLNPIVVSNEIMVEMM